MEERVRKSYLAINSLGESLQVSIAAKFQTGVGVEKGAPRRDHLIALTISAVQEMKVVTT
jgi:hypothetical protein